MWRKKMNSGTGTTAVAGADLALTAPPTLDRWSRFVRSRYWFAAVAVLWLVASALLWLQARQQLAERTTQAALAARVVTEGMARELDFQIGAEQRLLDHVSGRWLSEYAATIAREGPALTRPAFAETLKVMFPTCTGCAARDADGLGLYCALVDGRCDPDQPRCQWLRQPAEKPELRVTVTGEDAWLQLGSEGEHGSLQIGLCLIRLEQMLQEVRAMGFLVRATTLNEGNWRHWPPPSRLGVPQPALESDWMAAQAGPPRLIAAGLPAVFPLRTPVADGAFAFEADWLPGHFPRLQAQLLSGAALLSLLTAVALFAGGFWLHRRERALAGAMRRQDELRAEVDRLAAQLDRDEITGLCNRRGFERTLSELLIAARHAEAPVALILLEIDQFKEYSDHLGLATSESLLQGVAGLLRDGVEHAPQRGMTGTTAKLAHWDPGLFLLALPGQGERDAVEVAESLRMGLAAAGRMHPLREFVSLSAGVAVYRPEQSPQVRPLFRRAEEALVAARRMGRNRVMARSTLL